MVGVAPLEFLIDSDQDQGSSGEDMFKDNQEESKDRVMRKNISKDSQVPNMKL